MSVIALLATRLKVPPLLIEAFVAVLLLAGFAWHERHVQAGKDAAADARVIAAQQAAQAAQKAKDDKRVADAQKAYEDEHQALVTLRSTLPVDHVVCYAPRPRPVPAAADVRAPDAPGAGTLPQEGPRDTFDPGPALDELHDEADDLLAACRKLNDSVPH